MFIRTTRVKRGDKVYEYPQLVESYRREEDGRPCHRVIASLKGLSPDAIEAIRVVLAASRDGEVVVPPVRSSSDVVERHQVIGNLQYLPLAVFAALWNAWGLTALLDGLLPSASIVAHSQVILTLALHRCVDPDSKLAASRWYPNTALTELLGVKARHFNNSRVHRALDALGAIEGPLQDALAKRIHREPGGVIATYLDLTDTWFVGRGPDMARRGKTKEGLIREKVGIALLCDQRGFPLRWKTVHGARYEPPVMLDLLVEAAQAGALRGQPVVMDRIMGNGVHLDELTKAGVPYVTALVRNEFGSFVSGGPWEEFIDVEVSGSDRTRRRDLAHLAGIAKSAGMEALPDGCFVKDLGVAMCERPSTEPLPEHLGPIAELLREVAFMDEARRLGLARTIDDLAAWYDCASTTILRYLKLARLVDAVRLRALRGEAEAFCLDELIALAEMAGDVQEEAFDELLAVVATEKRQRGRPPKILDPHRQHLAVRRVVRFDPVQFIERHNSAREHMKAFAQWVAARNEEQRNSARPHPPEHLLADVRAYLSRRAWLDLFDVSTRRRRHGGRTHHEIVPTRRETTWRRRRKLDGFGVIVAHPTVTQELIGLYRSKDIVEKGFQLIKSELDLRPVRHHTDLKVCAHVSLCMLALLLQRSAEQRMAANNAPMTAASAITVLDTCHLNRVSSQLLPTYYTVTKPTQQQLDILRPLELEHLVDDDHVRSSTHPR